jgi:DNA-directed RNA polymerase subunit RPC12/RpoP
MSVLLRCSKCGSDAGFLIETSERKTLEVKSKLPLDRIKKAVLVTCTYCNNRWDHVPISLRDSSVDDLMRRAEGETKLVPKHVL